MIQLVLFFLVIFIQKVFFSSCLINSPWKFSSSFISQNSEIQPEINDMKSKKNFSSNSGDSSQTSRVVYIPNSFFEGSNLTIDKEGPPLALAGTRRMEKRKFPGLGYP